LPLRTFHHQFLESDRAQVAEARATVNTFLALLKSAQAQIEEAAANLQAAKLNESYTEIRAPEDGRVTEKAVEPGDYVQTGQTLSLSCRPTFMSRPTTKKIKSA
jgi:membrane fusion protein (multidrug efflux system)